MFTWVCCRGTLYGQHFKQICDPNKPKFHLSEVFLGDFDKKFHRIFVLFISCWSLKSLRVILHFCA